MIKHLAKDQEQFFFKLNFLLFPDQRVVFFFFLQNTFMQQRRQNNIFLLQINGKLFKIVVIKQIEKWMFLFQFVLF